VGITTRQHMGIAGEGKISCSFALIHLTIKATDYNEMNVGLLSLFHGLVKIYFKMLKLGSIGLNCKLF